MQQLSAQDASFIYLESAAAPMHVGSLCIYDGSGVPAEQLTEESIARSIDARLHLNPTMRRRLVRVPFEADYPYWIEDADFDLEYHVRRIALPSPGDRAALMKTVARIFSRPLDMTKPLWELYVIEGLDNVADLPPRSFAVLTKTHHAAVDGASGLHFLEQLHDLSTRPQKVEPPQQPWRPDPYPTDAELMLRTGMNNMTQPLRFAQTLARQFAQHTPERAAQMRMSSSPAMHMPRRVPKTRFNGQVSAHRVMGSIDVSLADIKRIRKAVAAYPRCLCRSAPTSPTRYSVCRLSTVTPVSAKPHTRQSTQALCRNTASTYPRTPRRWPRGSSVKPPPAHPCRLTMSLSPTCRGRKNPCISAAHRCVPPWALVPSHLAWD